MLATQLKYDLTMFFREIFYLVFSIIVPPVTYIFMGNLFGNVTYAGNLSYAQTYTPSFILLITFSVVFFAFGFDEVMNRTTGVEKRISISPLPKKVLLISNILKSIIITSFGFVLIYTIGIMVFDLRFDLINVLSSYGFFMILNVILLIISSAVYSFFYEMKSALVFSIILFQLVMVTGDFSMPVSQMPKFIQIIASWNPIYHMNHLFIDVWNEQFVLDSSTLTSIGFIFGVLAVALLVIRFANLKKA